MPSRRRSAAANDKDFISCTPKRLPRDQWYAAAKNAIREDPRNRPAVERLSAAAPNGSESPPHDTIIKGYIAVMATKYWRAGSVNLTVGFMEQTPAALADKILSHMNAWSARCAVQFTMVQGAWSKAQVRITRNQDGYWSYLGTDILQIPSNQATMCLQGFSLNTPESEYKRVVRHETGHCLAGGTLIDCPRDLKKYPLGVPINELVGTQPWVYAWKDGHIVVRKASRVWLSKKNAPTVRVTLRTGRGYHKGQFRPPLELIGTPDHPVLLADGRTWKNLGDLKAGDRLCSMYRSKNGPRSRITWTGLDDRVREHTFVAEQVYGQRPDGYDCHHKDENMLNQNVDNLEWKNEFDHHSDHSTGRKMSKEAVARRAAAFHGFRHSEETKAEMSATRKGKKMSAKAKANLSAATKGQKQSPALVEKRRQAMLRFYANGGRSGMCGKTASEETKQKQSESMKVTLARKRPVNHVVVSVEPWLTQDVYDMTVPDADSFVANGVVVHNSLGCPHEHMRQAIIAKLDRAKTIAYFMNTQGWSQQEVVQQVLTPLEQAAILGSPTADSLSIMCYNLPGSITLDGKPIPGGSDIDETDWQFMSSIYPKAGVPPVVPPTEAKLVVTLPNGTTLTLPSGTAITGNGVRLLVA